MDEVNIEKVANGFIVTQGRSQTRHEAFLGVAVVSPTYVFETFDALSAWLKENFESKQANTTS